MLSISTPNCLRAGILHSLLACVVLLAVSFALNALAAADNFAAAVDAPNKVHPIVVGSKLPTVMVENLDGETVNLAAVLGTGKQVLIVYRGGWCPYCMRHFAAIGMLKDQLEKRGWHLAALSPDNQAAVRASMGKVDVDGVLRLSDSDADALRALGLAYVLDQKTRDLYKTYHIDLEKASGQTHHILPVPAVLLIEDGEIRGLHADADYKRRLHPEMLTAMIDAIEADDVVAAKRMADREKTKKETKDTNKK